MTRDRFPPLLPRLGALCAALAVLGLAACGAPSRADGETGGQAFSVSDAEPEVRSDNRGRTTIVLAEEQSASSSSGSGAADPAAPNQLWLVILTLPEGFRPDVDETVKIGPEGSGLPTLEVAIGDIEIEDVDGEKVATTNNTKFIAAQSGELTFWNVEKVLAADFVAVLEGGGTIRGSFEAQAP